MDKAKMIQYGIGFLVLIMAAVGAYALFDRDKKQSLKPETTCIESNSIAYNQGALMAQNAILQPIVDEFNKTGKITIQDIVFVPETATTTQP